MAAVRTRRAAALVVAAAALLLCCGRCACAPGRPRVAHRAVVEMMARDGLFADVLAERVTLRDGDVPAADREQLLPPDAADDQGVDPMPALMALVAPAGEYQSGRHLTLAATVLGSAVRCFMYKRVAVNVGLLGRVAELGAADADLTARVHTLGELLVRVADMLAALDARHDELVELLRRAKRHRAPESFARDELTTALNDGVTALNKAVGTACKVTDAGDYAARLGRTDGSDAPAADAASLEAVTRQLDAGEDALLAEYERMYMLRAADVAVWKKLFDFADPQPAEGEGEAQGGGGAGDWGARFKRAAAAPGYRDTVVKLMDRSDKTAELLRRQAERAAAVGQAPAVVGYEDRAIPMAGG